MVPVSRAMVKQALTDLLIGFAIQKARVEYGKLNCIISNEVEIYFLT